MPIIKARSSSIINSVDLRGAPTAATAAAGTSTTQLANTAFVSSAVSDLINSAPAILDTLSELATAINDDANFATTVANSIATKLSKAGDTMTGFLTLSADPTSGLHAATKDYVDQEINAQMIYSTDDVQEGVVNLYYHTSAVRSDIGLSSDNTSVLDYNSTTGQFTYTHPTSDGILEGQTNKYYHTSAVRGDIGLNSDDNAILSYSNVTGQFTFTTPDTDKIVEGSINQYFSTTRARNSISNGSNINYDPATGIISTQAAVWSVNGQTGAVTLTTDDVTQGSTNLYFTNALAQGAISLTTNDTSILSYSNGAFTFAKPDTDKVAEGADNLYFTTTRARNSISVAGGAGGGSGGTSTTYSQSMMDFMGFGQAPAPIQQIAITSPSGALSTALQNGSIGADATISARVLDMMMGGYTTTVYTLSTPFTEINPGTWVASFSSQSGNDVSGPVHQLIVTTGASSGNSLLSYDSSSGVLTLAEFTTDDVPEGTTNRYYTAGRVRTEFSANDLGGDGSFTYDSATGTFEYTGPSASEARAHFSAVAGGDGSFTYDSATGTFEYTGPTNVEYRAAVSANDAGGDGSFSYDQSTGVFTYTGPSASEARAHFSATTASGVTYDSATGVIALASIPNASLTNSEVTVNGATISLGGSATLNADDIAEAVGGTNKYYTQARFDTAFGAKSTDDLAEGSNLYYTQARFDTALAAKDTSDVAEDANATATSGTQYFTQGRARNALSGGTGVSYDSTSGVIAIGQAVGTTDDVTFNNVTVAGDLTVQGTLTAIESNTVEIADINLTLAKGAANAAAANNAGLTIDGANATITYLSGSDSWNFNKDVITSGGLTATSVTVTGAQGFTGNLTGNVTGDVTGDLTGNADTATTLQTGRDIQGVFFDGSANITVVTAGTGVTVTGTAVAIGQSVGTSDNVTFNTVTADLTGDVTGNVLGNVTGTVSDISNHTTDTLTEGVTNLYSTPTRVRQALSATDAGGDGSFAFDSATGVFTYTGPSASEARAHFSAVDLGGDGSFSYDSASGAFTYTGPSASETRAHFNATSASGVTYDSATGVIALSAIPNSSLTNDSVTVNGQSVALGGSTTLDTDAINEGATNEYFTQTRARNAISLTTSDSSVLSYDSATGAFTFSLSGIDTDEVQELPNAINQYFTTARARASVSNGSNIQYDSATGVISTLAAVHSVNGQTGVAVLGTDDVSDVGATNKYFTQAAARGAINLTTDNAAILDYAPGTGEFTFVTPTTDAIAEGAINEYYTAAKADARIAAASILDLVDVDLDENNALTDGFSLVYNSALQKFVAQNVTVTVTTMNFTGDGTTTSFNTQLLVNTINDVQVFINGLIQAPTYSFTIDTVNDETSIVFDAAPEANDFIMVRLTPTAQLSAGGILNENSAIDGGTY